MNSFDFLVEMRRNQPTQQSKSLHPAQLGLYLCPGSFLLETNATINGISYLHPFS